MISSLERPAVLADPQAGAVRPAAWSPTEFSAAPATPTPPREPAAIVIEPVKTAAEWEQEIEAAYARGLAEGRAAGREEGVADGVAAGRAEESARLTQPIRALEEALYMVKLAEERRLSTLKDNLAALATAIARQIIGHELRGDAEMIADLVRRALVEFPIDQPLRVRLSPQDLSTISTLSAKSGEAVPIAPGRNLRWLADPRLEPGSCIVEGKDRIVDGRVDRALERIYRTLVDA